MDISKIFIKPHAKVKEALALLNKSARGVLLLVDENNVLVRTITDGDLRRLFLSEATLETPVMELPQQLPKTMQVGASEAELLEEMNRWGIDHMPLVDAKGIPQGLFHRRDFSAPILLSSPHMGGYEMLFIEEAFSTNWVSPIGPNVDAFEKELADYVKIKSVAAVSSGTAAIHLALRLLDVRPGDTIFCPSLTFVASANPILYQGAHPVFIDSEPNTWNMSPQALRKAFEAADAKGRLPKALILVHLYGQCADIESIKALCDHYHVPIIEDAAESLGAYYKGQASGTFGKLGVYSFNGNKIITTSGGGALISNDEEMIAKARFLATQARDHAPYYQHSEMGYNYRLSNILAGIGRGQLKVLEDRVQARREIFDRYKSSLQTFPFIKWLSESPFERSTRWLSTFYIDPKEVMLKPADIIQNLSRANIEARHIWKPLHLQPLFAHCEYYSHHDDCSVSDDVFAAGICLPSGSNMSVKHQNDVINRLYKIFDSIGTERKAS